MMLLKKKFVALALSGLVLGGCLSSNEEPALSAGDVFVLTSNNQLVSFNRTQPSVIRTAVAITGLVAGDTLVGMDFRPRDGQLYALARSTPGNGGRLYTLNTSTGAATVVATLTAHPADGSAPFTTLDPAATSFGFDFNPAADALRVISNTGQNLRIFVQTVAGQTPDRQAGFTFTDTNLTRTDGSAAPFADTAAAYTNSFDGTTSTRMFNIDVTNGNLIQQQDPNGGLTRVAAPLFAPATSSTGTNGFDIDARNNVGYALLTVGGSLNFYSIAIPPATSTQPVAGPAATSLGAVNLTGVVGMALAPATAPQAIALDGSTAGSQRLLKFGIRNPNAATATAVSGLAAGESLLSIDYRPSNGVVYGLTSAGRVYRINTDTGAASDPVTLSIANNIVNGLTDGKRYQIDFNPMADALRIVSSNGSGTQGENYRIPAARLTPGATDAGTTVTDTALSAGFNIATIAYTNSFASPAPIVTQLFNVDSAGNRLAQQGNPLATPAVSPNTGTLTEVGPFNTTFMNYGGFDISGGDNGMILMANRVGATGAYSLFTSALAAGPAPATTVAVGAASVVTGGTAEIGTGMSASTDIRALTIKF